MTSHYDFGLRSVSVTIPLLIISLEMDMCLAYFQNQTRCLDVMEETQIFNGQGHWSACRLITMDMFEKYFQHCFICRTLIVYV